MNTSVSARAGLFCRVAAFILSAAAIFAAPLMAAGVPATYYNAANPLDATTLRSSLNDIVTKGALVFDFNSNSFTQIDAINEDPFNSSNVILIYSGGASRAKGDHTTNDGNSTTGGYNREHAYVKTIFNDDQPAISDLVALFPADVDVNNFYRNDKVYNVVSGGTTDASGNEYNSTEFEPTDADKGDAARAMFYMDIRYDGESSEPNLALSESTGGTTGSYTHPHLSTLLLWNTADVVNSFESIRNGRVYDTQHNANPFVDHPEFATIIYGAAAATQAGDTITVTSPTNRAPTTCTPGAPNLPLLSATVTLAAGEWDIAGFTLSKNGTATDAEMGTVGVWIDADENGLPDGLDPLLASGSFSGGAATLACTTNFRLLAGNARNLLVTLTTSDAIASGKTAGVTLNTIVHGASGGADIDKTSIAASSTNYAIAIGTVKIVAFSTNDTVNSGATGATYEYIVLANQTNASINLSGWTVRRRSTANAMFTLNTSIPAFGHYLIASTNYGSSVGAVPITQPASQSTSVFTSGSSDTTAYSVTLFNASTVQIDGFSVNGGGDTSSLWEGTAFNAGNGSGTVTYMRKRAHSGSGYWVDTENNAYDEELVATKIPPSDASVPVSISAFSAE